MFDKISSKSLKRVLVLKYIVQLLGVPFVMGGGDVNYSFYHYHFEGS